MLQVKQVTIIGTGLLGASLALALKSQGFAGRLVGVGRRESTLAQTRALGCFDGLTTVTGEALEQAQALKSGEKHLAVLAAPLGHFREIFQRIIRYDDPGLVITDVGSAKTSVCRMANEILPEPARFVGSHPMAGSEQQGPTAADATLFQGKPCVLTPEHHTDPDALEVVESLWKLLGMRTLLMTPMQHDRNVALVSHLPHAMAALLVKVAAADGGESLDIASTGFADTTRVASGDAGLWVDIFESNQTALVDTLDETLAELERFRKMVARGDSGALRRLLQGAKETRDAWEGRRKSDA